MNRRGSSFCFLAFLLLTVTASANNLPKTRAESTNYNETSRYADVISFISGIQRVSSLVKTESFAVTKEGRELPLVVVSTPDSSTPELAAKSGKAIVLVMANIHAGEVEGKEASQHLLRDVASGKMGNLLRRVVLLIAPIYNADGNERIDIRNRAAQNGPSEGVGRRENAMGLDLNRDFIKIESPEARGLVGVFNRWDPHVVIDLHTTNGSYHGYHLTFSPSLNPNTDPRLIQFTRHRLLPSVRASMLRIHRYRTYFYGNFTNEDPPVREANPDSANPKAWVTFDHRPRFGNNYIGLRNRIAILSEAYSYLNFRDRVDVTDKFVRTTIQYIFDHSAEVVNLTRLADARTWTTPSGKPPAGYGVRFELRKTAQQTPVLVGSVSKTKDSRTGVNRFEAGKDAKPVLMAEYGEFKATRMLSPPYGYLLRPDQKRIIELLLNHGIEVQTILSKELLEVERYRINDVARANQAFQGHRETTLKGSNETSREEFPEGSFLIAMNQPKAALIFYLLEPESDDGLTSWNYFDETIDRAGSDRIFPVFRLKQPIRVASRTIR